MIRICKVKSFTQSKPLSWRALSSPFSSSSSSASTDNVSQSGGNNLSRLLTSEQKSLLHQAHQLAAQSRRLAKQVGNVAVREDSLLSEIVRLKNQHNGRDHSIISPTKEKLDASETSTICSDKQDDELPPSLFTVVFAGEFNSGKSTLINALLGKELLESGVLPTTDKITVLMSNDDAEDATYEQSTSGNLDNTSFPARLHLLPKQQYPLLSDLCVIDTPGTNAIMSLQHSTSTLRILHNADLLVFITSADRPFSESEQELLRNSITYRKRVLVVINKMDILERQKGEDHGNASKKRVIDYVTEHASESLGCTPVVIPVSARDALSVKMLGGKRDDGIWKRCNFSALEH
eukprot:scaffold63014_cov73-Cyclotella_meneghiniana.AAC.2